MDYFTDTSNDKEIKKQSRSKGSTSDAEICLTT